MNQALLRVAARGFVLQLLMYTMVLWISSSRLHHAWGLALLAVVFIIIFAWEKRIVGELEQLLKSIREEI